MRESRSLPQAIAVELLEQLAYLALLIQPAEKPAKERVQEKNHQENCLLARDWSVNVNYIGSLLLPSA